MQSKKQYMKKIGIVGLMVLLAIGCSRKSKEPEYEETYANIHFVGAMKEVMWKGELAGKIRLDTIADKVGLYAVGPVGYLSGEILVKNGTAYVAKIQNDSMMHITKNFDVSAPFLVYANVTEWDEIVLPKTIKSMNDLESFIDKLTLNYKRPFVFQLKGEVARATIHVQNLPPGTVVTSPKDAHQGQVKFELSDELCDIVGFFSTEHQGVFTHHDSFLHMHLITRAEDKMGHLDAVQISDMKLYLPKK
jgi:acetolactate decarboxylase